MTALILVKGTSWFPEIELPSSLGTLGKQTNKLVKGKSPEQSTVPVAVVVVRGRNGGTATPPGRPPLPPPVPVLPLPPVLRPPPPRPRLLLEDVVVVVHVKGL